MIALSEQTDHRSHPRDRFSVSVGHHLTGADLLEAFEVLAAGEEHPLLTDPWRVVCAIAIARVLELEER